MNIERKLEFFTNAVNQEVESRKREASHRLTASANGEITTALKNATEEARMQTQAQMQTIEKIMNKRVSTAQAEARRNLVNLRERLTAQFFDKVKEDVIAFTQSDEYKTYIIENVKKVQEASRYPFAFIQLTPTDMHLGEAIQEVTDLTPEEGDANMLGGFKLISQNRGKILEATFSSRLTQARQEFAHELNV